MAADLTRPSLSLRAITRRSSCSGGRVAAAAPSMPCSIAYVKTLGISSGRFSADSVTPATKYQLCRGSCGWLLRAASSAGVMTAVGIVCSRWQRAMTVGWALLECGLADSPAGLCSSKRLFCPLLACCSAPAALLTKSCAVFTENSSSRFSVEQQTSYARPRFTRSNGVFVCSSTRPIASLADHLL